MLSNNVKYLQYFEDKLFPYFGNYATHNSDVSQTDRCYNSNI